MKDHVALTDDEFYDQMESCVYRKKFFSHLAHIRLGWIHIQKFGAIAAKKTAPAQIKKYVTHIGMGDKYNHTISVAAVKILCHYMTLHPTNTFDELVAAAPELKDDFRGLLAKHYSDRVYTDPKFKEKFIPPTRQAFEHTMNPLFSAIAANCDDLSQQFELIDEDRKVKLASLSAYIQSVYEAQKTPSVIVICTHNSRRSHMGQLWIAAAAAFYGLPKILSYSGGTEGTAFYPSAVRAMRQIGFQIVGNQHEDNPHYWIQWRPDMRPYEAYSTRFDQKPNPTQDFGAIMVCNSADEACPIVPGADFRIALPFDDPKAFDGTDLEAQKYLERSLDIGREMLYVMSLIQ